VELAAKKCAMSDHYWIYPRNKIHKSLKITKAHHLCYFYHDDNHRLNQLIAVVKRGGSFTKAVGELSLPDSLALVSLPAVTFTGNNKTK
jgi:hypothetical protein